LRTLAPAGSTLQWQPAIAHSRSSHARSGGALALAGVTAPHLWRVIAGRRPEAVARLSEEGRPDTESTCHLGRCRGVPDGRANDAREHPGRGSQTLSGIAPTDPAPHQTDPPDPANQRAG